MTPTLTDRALNRALLARQLLLEPSRLSVPEAVSRLGYLQAQATNPPYAALFTRLATFDRTALDACFDDRSVVRVPSFRGTLHVTTAEHAVTHRPLVQPHYDRLLRGSPLGPVQDGLDRKAFVTTARKLLAKGPVAASTLAEQLGARFPDRDPRLLAYAVRFFLPVVQLPPQPTYALLDTWTGRKVGDGDAKALVRMYLGAFGPASVKDLQAFSGLTKLKAVVDGMQDELLPFRSEAGVPLFDLPDAPRPPESTEVGVKVLGEFDATLLSYADYGRLVTPERRKRALTSNGLLRGTVLIDGRVAGVWRTQLARGLATTTIEALDPWKPRLRNEVSEAVLRLARFDTPEARDHDLRAGPID